MKKTLLISSSLSSKSINQALLQFLHQFIGQDFEPELLSFRDYELPLYNIDREEQSGIPEKCSELMDKLKKADKLIFGIAEHNGSVTAAFKNTLDWLSRMEDDYHFLAKKEILLVGTSPSPYGAKNALDHAAFIMKNLGGDVKGQIPFPSYYTSFSTSDKGLLLHNEDLKAACLSSLDRFFKEPDAKSTLVPA